MSLHATLQRVKSYEQVHAGLFWMFGRASEHPCVRCGVAGKHWAYQYNAGDVELRSPSGAPYSENFDHYAPMCASCHRSLDNAEMRKDPEWARKQNESAAAGRARIAELRATQPDYEAWYLQERAQSAALGGAANAKRLQDDPEYASRMAEHRKTNGSKQWKCSECDMVSNSLGIGTHHKFSKHTGKEAL